MPLLTGCAKPDGRAVQQKDGLIIAVWNFGTKSWLYLIANLSDQDAHLIESSYEINKLSGTKAIFESSPGALVHQVFNGLVPAWSVVWAHGNN